ncbi:MAG: hypothetical protein HY820_35195 [Acidobacteria bacterium]|nr:hypothetical protein [Acidobacteriota bacterium]
MTILRAFAGAAIPALAAWTIGRLILRNRELPASLACAAGGALLSLVLFTLFLFHAAKPPILIMVALIAAAPVVWLRPAIHIAAPKWVWPIAAIYGGLYFLYALTPEVQSDALHYHLWLATQTQSTGGFPSLISFYNVLPQGMETLFALAYVIGGEQAAKLLHLACLFGCVTLMPWIAARLGLAESTGWIAGLLFAITPVVGISSTCAYTDATLVFYTLAALALLEANQPVAAGLCAGFCYAIKFNGGWIAGILFVVFLARRQFRSALLFTAAATIIAAPWIIRAFVLTGNPIAPLANSLFPNPYFHTGTIQNLSAYLRSYGGLRWHQIPFQLTIRGDILQGLLGPVFLALPVALLTLRNRAGRRILAIAILLAIPWTFNIGTRFLMPALPFLALALIAAVPRPLAFTLLAAHMVLSWPQAIHTYAPDGTWSLDPDIPIQIPATYAKDKSVEVPMSNLIRSNTTNEDRILDLINAPAAITRRHLVNVWQSASGDRIGHAMELARTPGPGQFYEFRARPDKPLEGLRLAFTQSSSAPTAIREVLFFGDDRQPVKPNIVWSIEAQPNPWEATLALDRNRASAWSTWQPVEAGMYWRVDFNTRLTLQEIRIIADNSALKAGLQLHDSSGKQLAADLPRPAPILNLRLAAMRLARREGITHVVAKRGESQDVLDRIGQALEEDPHDWSLDRIARHDNISLYRILP